MKAIDLVWNEAKFAEPQGQIPVWKRLLDIAVILFLSPVLVPLFVLIALGIKVASPGPVFFRQERVGHRGRRFTCLKFRSMKSGASTQGHQSYLKDLINSEAPMTKLDNRGDSRLIPFGAILRASGLDELPQLINVLRGDMSIVGPRPCTPYESEEYQAWHRERFDSLPGLTGLWQVSGKNRTTFNEMMRLDIRYVRSKSLWMDLRIIFLTFPTLLQQIWESKKPKSESTKNHEVERQLAA